MLPQVTEANNKLQSRLFIRRLFLMQRYMSGMMKAAGQMALLKILFLSILAHGMIFTAMFGFTTAYWKVD